MAGEWRPPGPAGSESVPAGIPSGLRRRALAYLVGVRPRVR